jgi:predicted transposase/invertase (TIGR01784 family)
MAKVGKSKTAKSSVGANITARKAIFEDAGVYINPLTDFGFKRIFGTEANKDLLIDFLNAILDVDGGIKDLTYTNPEKQGHLKTDPKIIFDLHCTTGKGERVIIEMQKLSQEYYKDRALYYASFPIQEQGEKRKKWDYMLCPVYSVNVVNFKLDKTRKVKNYISYIKLMDRDTYEVFYDKLTFVYMELPRFNIKAEELKTNVERWMYVLKHLSNLNDLPDALRNRIFKKLFEQAKIANMTKEEMNEYQQSLNNYRAMYLKDDEYKKNLAAKDRIIAANAKTYQKELAEKDAVIAKIIAEKDAKEAESAKKDALIEEMKRKFGVS